MENRYHAPSQSVLSRSSSISDEISFDFFCHPYTIQPDGQEMTMAGETEKLTLNLGPIDLGQIDLLVEDGFYSNRADFIRTAIRNQLATHAEVVRQSVVRKSLVLGLQHYSRQDLEALR